MAIGPPFSKILHSDSIINRIQDRIVAAINPLLTSQVVWTVPTLINGWTDNAGPSALGSASVGFTLDPLGWVQLRGTITGGVVGTYAFILPPGYRPKFRNMAFAASGNAAFASVDIHTGLAAAQSAGGVFVSAGAGLLSLNTVRFQAEA